MSEKLTAGDLKSDLAKAHAWALAPVETAHDLVRNLTGVYQSLRDLDIGRYDPARLAEAAAIGEDFGYDEINLNVGCPSDRVQEGRFGACLMREPALVGDCVAAVQARVRIPVTVKCRIGVDDQDAETDFRNFIDTVATAGCRVFVVHARKAWLEGLSPKENREIPPLDYARVHRLKAERPDLTIVLNGGLGDLDSACGQLQHVDGAMLGRAAYQTPYLLADVDRRIFGASGAPPTRADIIERLIPYAGHHLAAGCRLNNIARHILGLYHGRPRGRLYRRILSEQAVRAGAGVEVLQQALAVAEAGAGGAVAPAAAE